MTEKHSNPSNEEMITLLANQPGAGLTSFDSTHYSTKSSRINDLYNINNSRLDMGEIVQFQDWNLGNLDVIQVDGFLSSLPGKAVHVRLTVDASYASLAAIQQSITFNPNDNDAAFAVPDINIICTPGLKAPKLHKKNSKGFTKPRDGAMTLVDFDKREARILGCDLFDEIQSVTMLLWSEFVAQKGNTVVHGGIQSVHVPGEYRSLVILGGTSQERAVSVFGGDRNRIVQSNFISFNSMGEVDSPQAGSFVGVDMIDSSQRRLWNAATSESAIFQNAEVSENGTVDLVLSTGCKVSFTHPIRDDEYTEPRLAPAVSDIVYLENNSDLMPGIVKMTQEQFAAYIFAKGHDLFVGSGDHQDNVDRLYEFINASKADTYVLNINSLCGGFLPVPKEQHQLLLRSAVMNSIEYKKSERIVVEVAQGDVVGVDPRILNPALIYAEDNRGYEFRARAGLFCKAITAKLADYRGAYPGIAQGFGYVKVNLELDAAHDVADEEGLKAFMHEGVAYLTESWLFGIGYCCCDNDIKFHFCPFHSKRGIHPRS